MSWITEHKTKKGIINKYVHWREDGKIKTLRAGPYAKTALELSKQVDNTIVLNGSADKIKTVEEAVDLYLDVCSKKKKASTTHIAKYCLKDLVDKFDGRFIKDLKSDELNEFTDWLLKKRNVNGANYVIRNVNTFFNWAQKNGYVTETKAKECKLEQHKKKKVAKFLNRNQLRLLFQNMESDKLKLAVYSLLMTGMRPGEYLKLKKEDIVNNTIILKSPEDLKDDEGRAIPLNKYVCQVILKSLGNYTKSGLDSAWKRLKKKVDLGYRYRLYDMRHTFASNYLQGGGTLGDLQQIMGHSDLSVLQIYSHFQKDYLRSRMQNIKFMGG